MPADPYKQHVKEVMSNAVVTVAPDDTVHEALGLMEENGVTVLPVVNFKNHCIGIISSTDLLELTREMEEELGDLDRLSEEPHLGLSDLVSRHSLGQQLVKEIMNDQVTTVHPDATLVSTAEIMVENQIHRLPVVDDEQKLLGIVSTMDVLKAFVQGAPR